MSLQQNVTDLLRDGDFVHSITDVKDGDGAPILSPIQQMVDQRIRELVPNFCLQDGFQQDYQAIRHATFSSEQNVAKCSLTILGLRVMDGEKSAEEMIKRQLLNSDEAKGQHKAQINSLMEFCNVHSSNGKHFSTGQAILAVHFLTETKKNHFERSVRINLKRGLPYLRNAFPSDQSLTEYVAAIGVREKFPPSWSPQIMTVRTILTETKLNEPDRLFSYRINNLRSSPGLQIELKVDGEDRRHRLWISPEFFMGWTVGQHYCVDQLLEHVDKKTYVKKRPPLKPKMTTHDDPSKTPTQSTSTEEIDPIGAEENPMEVEEETGDDTTAVLIPGMLSKNPKRKKFVISPNAKGSKPKVSRINKP